MHIVDDIEVKQNLHLIARERGKIVARRDGHNIWLNLGREWLARLIAYSSFGPDTPEEDARIKYIGFGIGGTQQLISPVPNPVGTVYPGTNTQTDTDAAVTTLERPVRVSGSETVTPGLAGDVWLGQVQAPAVHTLSTQTTFSRLFTSTEISYGTLQSVPISEVGLFLASADVNSYANTCVAYDTFDSLSKTAAIQIEVQWTIRF